MLPLRGEGVVLFKFLRDEHFEMDWRRLFTMAVLIILIGATLVLASLFHSDVMLLFAGHLSWLPLSGLIFFGLGMAECFEAFVTKESREFHQNLQVGVLDCVIGSMMFLSVAEELIRYSMMIAAFLIVRGTVRIVLVNTLKLPQALPTSIGGVVAVLMGVMIWQQWPTAEGWFVALCVNLEIVFRGWAMMMFSLLVRQQKLQRFQSSKA